MLQRQELINLRRTTTNLMLAGILLAGAGSALAQDGYDWDLAGDSASSVSLAGDVNGDGYSDWVLGDENAVNQFSQATGMIRLVYGAQNGPGSGMADDFRWGSWSGDRFGRSVSLAGDVNGDGYDDIIVGSPGYQYALPDDAGRVSLFLGGPSGLASSPVWTHQGSVNNELLGSYVTALGDVNGDGYDDFAFTYAGWHLQVAYGSSSGQPGSLQSIDAFEYPGSLFNYGPAGDVDGDGYDDLVMGLPYVHNGTYSNGAIGVYLGGSSGLPAQPDQKLYWIRSSDDQLRSDLGSTVGTPTVSIRRPPGPTGTRAIPAVTTGRIPSTATTAARPGTSTVTVSPMSCWAPERTRTTTCRSSWARPPGCSPNRTPPTRLRIST